MEILRSFKGACRGIKYEYQLIKVDGDVILSSYSNGFLLDDIDWTYTKEIMPGINQICDKLENNLKELEASEVL